MNAVMPKIVTAVSCPVCGCWTYQKCFTKANKLQIGIRTCRGKKGFPLYVPPQGLDEVDEETRKHLVRLRLIVIAKLEVVLAQLKSEVGLCEIKSKSKIEDSNLNSTQEERLFASMSRVEEYLSGDASQSDRELTQVRSKSRLERVAN